MHECGQQHRRIVRGNRLIVEAEQLSTGSARTIYNPDSLSLALEFRTPVAAEISNPGRIAIGEFGPVNGGERADPCLGWRQLISRAGNS